MLQALGNPVRCHMVRVLAERKMCITGKLVEFTTLAQSTVSQHLKVLLEAGWWQAMWKYRRPAIA